MNKARGDARAATENLASELKRHMKRAEDEAEVGSGSRLRSAGRTTKHMTIVFSLGELSIFMHCEYINFIHGDFTQYPSRFLGPETSIANTTTPAALPVNAPLYCRGSRARSPQRGLSPRKLCRVPQRPLRERKRATRCCRRRRRGSGDVWTRQSKIRYK